MTAFRSTGTRGLSQETINPGDTNLVSGIVGVNSTVGASTLTAAQLITDSVYRSGSTSAYTDTFDTAANIYNALSGNGSAPSIVPGLGFTVRITNSVAYVETLTLGAGMVAGVGTVTSIAASSWRDFLFTFTSVQPSLSNICNTTNGSPVVTWTLSPGQTSELQGPSLLAINLMPGASVSGTGIPAGATVIGITEGQGGTLGFTMSANATATNSNVALSFGPTITVNSSGSGTL